MDRKLNLILGAVITMLAGHAMTAQADPLAEQGRDIFKKNQRAVVTVQVVQKSSYSVPGRSSSPTETKQDLTGTVVDPSGLTVLALSACDPVEMYQRMMAEEYSKYKVESEVSDIKILLDDGTEIPSEIVLRDKDLDLAFIRPKTKPASPMAAVDLSQASPAEMLDQVITLNRLNRAAGRAYAASVERISAVIKKPRTFYIPDATMSTTTLGSPAFSLNGNVLGMVVMRTVNSAGGSSANYRDSLTSIILPASDILKAAKQAPEAKGEDEKKDAKDTKETKDSKESKETK
jgi:S1-C subfamily serine protease